MAERRRGAGDAGIADENIELAVTLVQGCAEPRDAVKIGQAERYQRRLAAILSYLVVEFFQPALGARDRNNVRAGLRECACRGIADAARGAGDESDTVGEGEGH